MIKKIFSGNFRQCSEKNQKFHFCKIQFPAKLSKNPQKFGDVDFDELNRKSKLVDGLE